MENTDPRMTAQEKAKKYKEEMVGKRYRHFKGGIYVVEDIAIHSESAELMVVYKSFLESNLAWVRPLEMFLSEVDHKKYPEVAQKLRFEPMNRE